MGANSGTTYTYNSVTVGASLDGTFQWTTANPPTTNQGSLGSTYTLADGTALTLTTNNVNGLSVDFSITTGGVTYTFSGNFNNGNNNFNGRVTPTPSADPGDWTASAQ